MSAPTELSCAVSGIMSVVVFAAMQVLQDTFKSSELGTIAGGLIGSILFLLLLTFINNFENLVLDKGFASSLIPEVLIALGMVVFSCGLIHRVCATTSIIFSLIVLYYLNKLSEKKYGLSPAQAYINTQTSRSKKKN
ncbi:protein KRTCAP2 homolog [Convolutriloba macropyga]|uniref:protein KRTCAP2 homolog n=1 Tax=Convolutriloba macropyga TaxID=536237 RepID=UPI003F51D008